MGFVADHITVSTTPTRLDPAPDVDGTVGKSVLLCNRGAVPIYIGGPGVTMANGFQVDPGQAPTTDHLQAESLWAVTETGTCLVHVLQQGV